MSALQRFAWRVGVAGALSVCLPAPAPARQCDPTWLGQPIAAALAEAPECFGTYEGELIAGGYFTHAGTLQVNRIALWTGASWVPLGSGMDGFGSDTVVRTLVEYEGDLIAGGSFNIAGGAPVSGVARWNGANWAPMGSNMGVSAFLLHEGVLHGGPRVWNGSQWALLGAGLIGGGVFSLVEYQGEPVAGGNFTHSGGVYVNGVARWDGTAWRPIGSGLASGFEAITRALAVWRGELYGAWNAPEGGRVSRWDGTWWVQLPVLVASPVSTADELTIYRDQLIAAGSFTSAGGVPANSVARWNGASWAPLGSGVNGLVFALGLHDTNLLVGGGMTMAGGLPAPRWARWGCPCYPDCNNSGAPTVADFGCFQTQFVKGDFYADCNSDDALTVADFACFQTRFVQGCP